MFRFGDGVESDVYNTLRCNKEHTHCSLILKTSYKHSFNYALYCADHDFFLRWVSYDDFHRYAKLGINKVEYPDNDKFLSAFLLPDYHYAYSGLSNTGLHKPKTTKVTNYKTGKKTDIWVAFKGNQYRDPSLPAYWKFIEKFI